MTIEARYENGVFKPLQSIEIEEGTVVEVHVPSSAAVKPRSIRELGFVGMWADRDDIVDGVSYVDKLRDRPRG